MTSPINNTEQESLHKLLQLLKGDMFQGLLDIIEASPFTTEDKAIAIMQFIEAHTTQAVRKARVEQKRKMYMDLRQMLLKNESWTPMYKEVVLWMQANGYEIAVAPKGDDNA